MRIKKLEQSGFIIEADSGYKLGLDIGTYSPVDKLDDTMIDAMIVSHLHGDHFSIPQIKKLSPKKLYLNRECIELLGEEEITSEIIEVKVGDSINVEGFKVLFFDVDHGPNATLRPQENFGFLIEVDNKKIYFAGDMFYPSDIDVSGLEVERALIPVGTHYTFGPKEAVEFASTFKRIGNITPMHYEKTPETRQEFITLAIEQGLNTESFML